MLKEDTDPPPAATDIVLVDMNAEVSPLGQKRVDYLRKVIHFRESDAGAAILARDDRGVCAGRQCHDNR